MEVNIVRFSRPLLLMSLSGYYQTIYGFWIRRDRDNIDPERLNQYVGYLCGMADWAGGGKNFTISRERGVPDWVDKGGNTHTKMDNWMARIGEKCRKKLGLDYELVSLDVDEDKLTQVISKDDFVISEEFYYDLLNNTEDDELPF